MRSLQQQVPVLKLRSSLPVRSAQNPFFEQRTTFKAANDPVAHPKYNGIKIDKLIDPAEVVIQLSLLNQLDGTIKEAKN
jgi:hypothetical protein